MKASGGSMAIGMQAGKNKPFHDNSLLSSTKFASQRKGSMHQEEVKDFSTLLNDQSRAYYQSRASEQKNDLHMARRTNEMD